jgi:hypothetical protein
MCASGKSQVKRRVCSEAEAGVIIEAAQAGKSSMK